MQYAPTLDQTVLMRQACACTVLMRRACACVGTPLAERANPADCRRIARVPHQTWAPDSALSLAGASPRRCALEQGECTTTLILVAPTPWTIRGLLTVRCLNELKSIKSHSY